MKIGIIIPYYNGDEFIESCLESIKLNYANNLKVYIINNSDRATNIHSIANAYDWVRVYDTKKRIGFGKANNIGAELAISNGADIIISINQDAVIDKDCIKELLAPFQIDSDIHITAPICLIKINSIGSNFIKFYLSQCPEIVSDSLYRTIKLYYQVNSISGACFAIRTSTIKSVGLFDPLYFMYFEDDDLCRRIRYINKKIVIVTNAKVMHLSRVDAKFDYSEYYSYNDTPRLKRASKDIYILKEINKSLIINVLIILRNKIVDIINIVGQFKMGTLFRYFVDDIRMVLILNKIIKSRNIEKNILTANK